ncbi:hypothetical protein JCM3766R1_004839 [Sporobolomyces carnicolor]
MTDYAATALGLSHLAVGASTLISPRLTCSIFLLSYTPTSSFSLVSRLFGARELLVGYNVFSATSSSSIEGLGHKRWAVRLANWMNAIDVASCLVEWIKSDCTDTGALFGVVGAAALLGLGMWSARNETLARKG